MLLCGPALRGDQGDGRGNAVGRLEPVNTSERRVGRCGGVSAARTMEAASQNYELRPR